MLRQFLRAKLHRVIVTAAELDYEGSITIDSVLLESAGIDAYEKVSVVNVNNGQRFETYVMRGKPGAGEICLNGAAARLGLPGDKLIVFSYGFFDAEKIPAGYTPRVVYVDEKNHIKKEKI